MPPQKRKFCMGRKTHSTTQKKAKRQKETVEEQELRRMNDRLSTAQGRSIETVQQQELQRDNNRLSTSRTRTNEMVLQTSRRQEQDRRSKALARAQEHSNSNRMAFTYDPSDPLTLAKIGQMDKKCRHCAALKFNGETKECGAVMAKSSLPLSQSYHPC